MGTKTKIRKSIQLKLARVLMIGALICLSFKANAQCSASYTYSVDPANNGGVTFSYTGTWLGMGLSTYYWDFGDGGSSLMSNPGTYTYATSGTYNVCVTFSDSISGCFNTFCSAITVLNTTGSAPCSASFVASDSAGYTYFQNTSTGSNLISNWSFGDMNSGTSLGDITHLYSAAGDYYVCLNISDSAGTCTSYFCDTITVASGSSGACMGVVNPTYTYTETAGTVNFSNTPSGSGPVYFWDFGDGTNSSVVGNTSHTYASNGIYLVCLTVYETGTGTDSCQYCSYVPVSGIPAACSLTMNVVQDSTNLYNYFVYYTASTPGITTYLWDFGDGTTSTLPYPSHTYATTTPVVVCLTIGNGLLCTQTVCDSITPGMAMSNTFTLNAVNPLGVEEQSNTIASLENYPNPFGDHTTITYSIKQSGNVMLSIYDLLGNKVAELENSNKASGEYITTWNAQSISEGMYLLQLKVGNNISTKKIIVNK